MAVVDMLIEVIEFCSRQSPPKALVECPVVNARPVLFECVVPSSKITPTRWTRSFEKHAGHELSTKDAVVGDPADTG